MELAEFVADGGIRLDDPRIEARSGCARRLRRAALEAARLDRLLQPQPTPLIVPDNLAPSDREVDIDPWIGRATYVHRFAWAIPSEEALEAIVAPL